MALQADAGRTSLPLWAITCALAALCLAVALCTVWFKSQAVAEEVAPGAAPTAAQQAELARLRGLEISLRTDSAPSSGASPSSAAASSGSAASSSTPSSQTRYFRVPVALLEQWVKPAAAGQTVGAGQAGENGEALRTAAGLQVDGRAIGAWVARQAAAVSAPPHDGLQEIDTTGTLVRRLSDPVAGQQVSNLSQLQEEVRQAVAELRDYRGVMTLGPAPGQMREQLVAAVAPAPFSPQPGQKWIDVNLTTNTTTAYEGNQRVIGPVASVSGHRLSPTITGTYQIYQKTPQQVLTGVGFDGPYRETAPWIMYFHGDYALHGAPWRSSFVYDPEKGSHGCVNLQPDQAQAFFEWAEIGTTVVSHY